MTANDAEFGILAAGFYAPRLRLDRAVVARAHRWMAPGLKRLGKGSRAMANWDEDAITMGVEAARLALAARPDAAPETLTLCSTTLPFADRSNAGVVRSALGLPQNVSALDVAGSLRSGSTALLRALTGSGAGPALVIASDRRIPKPASPQELLAGDGSAAILVGQGEPVARLLANETASVDFVDHFRETGRDADYAWEERWVRDEGFMKLVPPLLEAVCTKAGRTLLDVSTFIMPSPLPGVARSLSKRIGLEKAHFDPLQEEIGELGTAQSLALLARALSDAKPGETILLANFASGVDAFLFEVTEAISRPNARPSLPLPGRKEEDYLKYLSFTEQLEPEWGMRAEMDTKAALSAFYRAETMVTGFEGGICSACGTRQFPKARICVNPNCAAVDTQDDFRFADIPAEVASFTADWLSYYPSPPFQFGHVTFEGGGKVLMEFTDADAGSLEVGQPLKMVFRIKDKDPKRGFRRYFWKAVPPSGAA